MEIKGTTALVTGGASGLGAATARELTRRGAKVAILDLSYDKGEALASEIDGLYINADVSSESEVAAAVDRVVAELGAARIAVNCAGIGPAARVVGREGELSIDLFRRTIAVNLTGTYNVISHAARAMRELEPTATDERGVVVSTASIAWQDGQYGQAAYAASKGGIASMMLPIAREFARSGIRCAAIAPGLFHTPMMEGLPDDVTEKIVSQVPFPARLGAPEEFGTMVAQIVENPYLNGTTIRLDGAARLPPR